MNKSICFMIAAGTVLLFGNVSQASLITLLSDNFDGYANQAAFQASWAPVVSTSGTLTSATSSSAPNSIRFAPNPGVERNQRSFAESSTVSTNGNLGIGDKLIFSLDFYDSNGAASPYRGHHNLQDGLAPTLTNQLVSLGLNNNQTVGNSGGNYYMARILGYTPSTVADPDGGPAESVGSSGSFFKLNDFGVGLRSTGWQNLKVEITTSNGTSTDYAFYVNGLLAELVTNVGTVVRSYDVLRIGSGVTSAEAYNVDNVSVQFIPAPEPASFVLVGLASFVCLGRRTRVKA